MQPHNTHVDSTTYKAHTIHKSQLEIITVVIQLSILLNVQNNTNSNHQIFISKIQQFQSAISMNWKHIYRAE